MTVKEKAIAYDKALEIARQYWNNRAMPIGTNFKLERMFPELKESEGEKIKNFIFNELACLRATDERGTARYNELTEAIVWLEKQGQQKPVVIIPKFRVGDEIKTSNEESLTITKIDENGYWSEDLFICGFDEECIWDLVGQKHADKIEPKFKVGDWIIYKNDIWKICNISLGAYYELLKVDGEVIIRHFEGVDKTAHLWTVKDAKDGDVLVGGGQVFLFKRMDTSNSFYAHCSYHFIGYDSLSVYDCSYSIDNICPATKKLRDVLMKAIADAGYTFDFEKKELKKIEQKSVELSADDLPEFESYLCLMFQKFRTKGVCTNGEIVDFVKEHSQKLKDTLCYVWGEEDENRFKNLIELVEQSNEGKGTKEGFIKFINRLKSLRPQNRWKPSAWSKDDEGYFNSIAHALSVLLVDPYFDEIKLEHIGWFNSLKNRYTWKPSDEQIETLKCACGGNYVNLGILESLYNDLKKL